MNPHTAQMEAITTTLRAPHMSHFPPYITRLHCILTLTDARQLGNVLDSLALGIGMNAPASKGQDRPDRCAGLPLSP